MMIFACNRCNEHHTTPAIPSRCSACGDHEFRLILSRNEVFNRAKGVVEMGLTLDATQDLPQPTNTAADTSWAELLNDPPAEANEAPFDGGVPVELDGEKQTEQPAEQSAEQAAVQPAGEQPADVATQASDAPSDAPVAFDLHTPPLFLTVPDISEKKGRCRVQIRKTESGKFVAVWLAERLYPMDRSQWPPRNDDMAWEDCEQFDTVKAAVVDALEGISAWWTIHSDDKDMRAKDVELTVEAYKAKLMHTPETDPVFAMATTAAEEVKEEVNPAEGKVDSQVEDKESAESPTPVAPQESKPADAKPAFDADKAEQDFRRRVAEAEHDLSDAMLYRINCEESLKAAKEVERECAGTLRSILARGPERMSLFDQAKPDQARPAEEEKPASKPAEVNVDTAASPAAPSAPIAGEAWRSVTTQELGIPKGICSILDESDIKTLGAIADWSKDGKPLTKIPKIGDSKAEKIEKACEEYWKNHQ